MTHGPSASRKGGARSQQSENNLEQNAAYVFQKLTALGYNLDSDVANMDLEFGAPAPGPGAAPRPARGASSQDDARDGDADRDANDGDGEDVGEDANGASEEGSSRAAGGKRMNGGGGGGSGGGRNGGGGRAGGSGGGSTSASANRGAGLAEEATDDIQPGSQERAAAAQELPAGKDIQALSADVCTAGRHEDELMLRFWYDCDRPTPRRSKPHLTVSPLRPQDSEYLARQLYAAAMEHLPWSVEDFHALAFTELLNSTTATVEQREICAMFVCLSGVVWASYEDYYRLWAPSPSERKVMETSAHLAHLVALCAQPQEGRLFDLHNNLVLTSLWDAHAKFIAGVYERVKIYEFALLYMHSTPSEHMDFYLQVFKVEKPEERESDPRAANASPELVKKFKSFTQQQRAIFRGRLQFAEYVLAFGPIAFLMPFWTSSTLASHARTDIHRIFLAVKKLQADVLIDRGESEPLRVHPVALRLPAQEKALVSILGAVAGDLGGESGRAIMRRYQQTFMARYEPVDFDQLDPALLDGPASNGAEIDQTPDQAAPRGSDDGSEAEVGMALDSGSDEEAHRRADIVLGKRRRVG